MTRLDGRGVGPRHGLGIHASLGPVLAAEVAREAERLGYASFWTNDTGDADGLAMVRAALETTTRVRAGVGVIPCDRRPPAAIADAVRRLGIDLERAVIGIGSGRSSHPVENARSAVAALRTSLPGILIGVAAMGPRMCRLAGEVGDVVLLNWMTPERIRWARARVAEGAELAGRDPADVKISSYVRVAVGAGAEDRLAAQALQYARNPAYERNFAAMHRDVTTVGIAARHPEDVGRALEPYRLVLDETIVRVLPAAEDLASVLAVARAGAAAVAR